MRRSAPRVTTLNTSNFILSAQAATLVHSTEVDACLCNATTPWKQGDFRLKLHAADVTMNSFYCLDNQSVDEFMCCLFFVAALVKTLRSENCVKNKEMKMCPQIWWQFMRRCLTALWCAQQMYTKCESDDKQNVLC